MEKISKEKSVKITEIYEKKNRFREKKEICQAPDQLGHLVRLGSLLQLLGCEVLVVTLVMMVMLVMLVMMTMMVLDVRSCNH